MLVQRVGDCRNAYDIRLRSHASADATKTGDFRFYGILKNKNTLMIFDKHVN